MVYFYCCSGYSYATFFVRLSHIVCGYAHLLICRILLWRYLTIYLFHSSGYFGSFQSGLWISLYMYLGAHKHIAGLERVQCSTKSTKRFSKVQFLLLSHQECMSFSCSMWWVRNGISCFNVHSLMKLTAFSCLLTIQISSYLKFLCMECIFKKPQDIITVVIYSQYLYLLVGILLFCSWILAASLR